MKRLILFFSVLYIFSATELHEALKIPFLFKHYSEHKNRNNDLSFLDFIKIHYSKEKTVYPDYDDDMKLPYKSDDKNIITTSFISFRKINAEYLFLQTRINTNSFPLGVAFATAGVHDTVWQPPKV